ncbi:DUF192 domain-containing protein [Peredibacter sp. HCB2-198]|uniref:DUF192 domain-containing protein n=1 Tax=Peredibacter sp. HCB2-198 TaxID=3383025 RepID=UPI0038B4315C
MRKFLTLALLLVLFSCQSVSRDPLKKVELVTPAGVKIDTTLAITEADQNQGLSGVKEDDFDDNQGMLFFYAEDFEKYFWMPDTYFDLDLFYMDKDLRILDIVRRAPHYVGRASPELIPRIRGVWCRHVLEMKSTSEIAKALKIGDKLEWKSSLSLQETEAKIKSVK